MREHVEIGRQIELLALNMAEDDEDKVIARVRIAELRQSPEKVVEGDRLRERLDKIETE